jgi:hypothetical protein
MTRLRSWIAVAALFVLAACGGGDALVGSRPDWQPAPGATPASGTYVYLESESNDYIGQGQTRNYTQTNAQILMTTSGARVRITVSGSENWTGEFLASDDLDRIVVGFWGDLPLYPPANPADGGIAWSGDGRSCTSATGWFVIDRVGFRGVDVSSIEMRFEQRCNGGQSVLHGKIRIEL